MYVRAFPWGCVAGIFQECNEVALLDYYRDAKIP